MQVNLTNTQRKHTAKPTPHTLSGVRGVFICKRKSKGEKFLLKANSIKLGSLFDGIEAFPYAASFLGIEPLWASEILPNSVSITKRHFPQMEHLGDITKLDGGKISPVDCVCFGSPCQSFLLPALAQASRGNPACSGKPYELSRK